ncbi:MAG: response regulator [Kofleriaceae bacterium]
MSSYRILVVDDYPDAAEVIGQLLSLLGHEVAIAVSGAEAVATATTFQPTLALIDIGLPDISGYEVARQLRTLAADRPVYLIAISGWAEPKDRVQALAAGFDHHVLKPIDLVIAERMLSRAHTELAARTR